MSDRESGDEQQQAQGTHLRKNIISPFCKSFTVCHIIIFKIMCLIYADVATFGLDFVLSTDMTRSEKHYIYLNLITAPRFIKC